MTMEERTARLTLLVDPRKKAVFERLCAEEDQTPSQVVRRLMREYIERRLGKRQIGFSSELDRVKETGRRPQAKKGAVMSSLETEDLVKFGLIPEFVGRFPPFTF